MIDLFWRTIGDVFQKQVFPGQFRRPVEALWRVQQDLAADTLEYTQYLKDARSLFSCPPYAPAGTFPIHPSYTPTDDQFDIRLVGVKKEQNWLWVFWVGGAGTIPDQGHFEIGNYSKDYTDSTVIDLESGGRLVKLAGTDTDSVPPIVDGLMSQTFDRNVQLGGRWRQDTGRDIARREKGFYFDVRGSDWLTLYDEEHIDGVNDWRMLYRFEVTQWDEFPDLENARRHVSLQSIGDTGPEFEVTLRQDNDEGLLAEMGYKGGTHFATTPVPDDWLSTLRNASSSAPMPLELELEYEASSSSMTATISFNGDDVRLTQAVNVDPGRRKHVFGVYNSHNKVRGYLTYVVGTDGNRWREDPTNMGVLASSFPYQYDIHDDIIQAQQFRISPWDFAPPANISVQDGDFFTVDIDQGWNDYTPEAIRIEQDGEWWLANKTDENEYELKWSSDPSLDIPSRARLHPWYLESEEIDVPSAGTLATKYPIPDIDRGWLDETRMRTVDLYNRFGRVLGAPNRVDSPTYLQNLRGMHMGKTRRPTPVNLQQALEVFLELPYIPEGGTIEEIRPGRQTDEVVVDNEVFEIDSYWRQQGYLLKEGQTVPQNGTLAKGVRVYDWRTGDMPGYISEWEKWGTFMVEIPGGIGLALNDLRMMQVMLEDSKKQTKNYKVEFRSDLRESTDLDSDMTSSQTPVSNEDVTFQDGPSVVSHPDAASTADATPQRQSNKDLLLSDREMLDRQLSLGSLNLHRLRVGWRAVGDGTLGESYPENYSIADGELRWYETVDLKRGLSDLEKDFNFQKSGLRMADLVKKPTANNARMMVPRHPVDQFNVYQKSVPQKDTSVLFLLDASDAASSDWSNIIKAAMDNIADNYASNIRARVVAYRNDSIVELLAYGDHTASDLKNSWSSLTFNGNRPLGLAVDEIVTSDFHKNEPLRDHLVFITATGGNDDGTDAADKARIARNARNNIQVVGVNTTASILDDVDDDSAVDATSQSEIETGFANMQTAKRVRRATLPSKSYETGSTPDDQLGVDIRDYDDIVTCGKSGSILKSTDYGQNWTDNSVSTTEDFYSTDNDWYVGQNGTVWQSGSSVSISAQNWNFRRVTFFDLDHGGISGFLNGDGVLVKTNDGGSSWIEEIHSGDEFLDHTQQSEEHFWFATRSGKVMEYESGAFQTYFTDGNTLQTVEVLDHGPSHILLAGGTSGKVFRSTDGGENWSENGVTGYDIQDLAFIDHWRVLMSDTGGQLFRSLDRGETWTQVQSVGSALQHIGTEKPWYQLIVGLNQNTIRWT